jgi:hypothetical protein
MAEEAAKTAEAESKSAKKSAAGSAEAKGDSKSGETEEDDMDNVDLSGEGDATVAGMLDAVEDADDVSMTHRLAFTKKVNVLVREEAMGERVFGKSAR